MELLDPIAKPSVQKKPVPTVQEVLNWAVKNNGVVMSDWAKSPTRARCARIVLPQVPNSVRGHGTSPVIKEVINEFYPHVDMKIRKHAVAVKVREAGLVKEILFLESNLEVKHQGLAKEKEYVGLEFPAYSAAHKASAPTIFLGVEKVLVQRG